MGYSACNEENIDEVLTELREYATEIDVYFVRKAVRAIGKLTIKIEPASHPGSLKPRRSTGAAKQIKGD
ncbi:hypothetical protein QBC39DRAFT_361951 [Podospora conica]|nr:hypothetical protein QBC39DRAFT_361951 [Schizothecium conicum]